MQLRPARSRAVALAVAALAAGTLITPALRASEPPVTLRAHKVDAPLRSVIANGGYVDDSFYASLDGHRAGDVYYLAKLTGRPDAALLDGLVDAGARVRHTYRAVDWVALASPVDAVAEVSAVPQVVRLDADLTRSMTAEYTAQVVPDETQAKRGTGDVGAPDLWAAGVDGSTVTVGIADTGSDSTHPDLANLDWFADCTASTDPLGLADGELECRDTPGYDDHGHGTHVAGIAAGNGAQSDGAYRGVAPGAEIAAAKVMNAAGVGLSSDIAKGFELLALERAEGGAGADVINASLGSGRFHGAPLFGATQVTNADFDAENVNALAEDYNVVFTISAGNSGPTLQSVGSPGVAAQALSVAASVSDHDLNHPVAETEHGEFGDVRPEAAAAGASALADFSSRGPSGDRLIKPEVTAPGVYWIAAETQQPGELKALDAAHLNSFSDDPYYAVLSGTSMSAPAAAGAAALVIDGWNKATSNAAWRYHEIKAALVNTAGDRSFDGPVSGAISTVEIKARQETPNSWYALRNEGFTGVTGEGAGRLHAGRALYALTDGVTAWTAQLGPLDDVHELQPSWSMDELVPGESAATSFALRRGPNATDEATLTFSSVEEPQATGVFSLPASWLTLPPAITLGAGVTGQAGLSVTVPAGAAAGLYSGIVTATADLGNGVTQTLRIPVQLYVPLVDTNTGEGTTASLDRTDLWAAGTTDYSYAGALNPLGDILTDWITYPVRLPMNVSTVTITAWDPGNTDAFDIFVFDDDGNELDSTVSGETFALQTELHDNAVPAGAAVEPTGPESPASVTLLDEDDGETASPGDTVWVVLSNTKPGAPPEGGTIGEGFSDYHLEVDVVTGDGPPLVESDRVHGGEHAWWGGSKTDALHLVTKQITVPDVAAPQLTFWTWYELEDGYDFGYVLVKEPGEAAWTALPTTGADGAPGTTDQDVYGLAGEGSKGWKYGFTGVSGTSATFSGAAVTSPEMTQQIADLSAYTGKTMDLAFAYTSDGGVNWEGFYVDDIEVTGSPVDGVETTDGWTADGFRQVRRNVA